MKKKQKQMSVTEVVKFSEELGNRDSRDAIHGIKERGDKRKSMCEVLEAAKELKKELKKADTSKMAEEEKKAHDEVLKKLKKSSAEISAVHREFGGIDVVVGVNGIVNIGISVAGGAIAANVMDGDYLSRIVSNAIGCVGVDALTHLITTRMTGVYGEGWKKNAFKGVVITVRVGGAAAASASLAHYAYGKDPIEAALTAVITQGSKIGLEWVRDSIMGW